MSDRVPRILHYCWFGGGTMSLLLRRCLRSWRAVMPGYQLRQWDESNFDLDALPFTRDAAKLRKWAFVADYVRLHALHTEGGVYLDTDVQVFRPFDGFLKHRFFSSHEIHPFNRTEAERRKTDAAGLPLDPADRVVWINVQSAVMGSEPAHPFLKRCLEYYEHQRLIASDGTPQYKDFVIGPRISKIAEQFGYRYHPEPQQLSDGMMIFGAEVFVGNAGFIQSDSYSLHLANGSWHDRGGYGAAVYRLRNRFPALSPALTLWEKVVRNFGKPFAGGTRAH